MPGKRLTPEQIIGVLRQAEVDLAQGRTVSEVCRGLGVSEASFSGDGAAWEDVL